MAPLSGEISFRVATFLLPVATALHMVDEWPGFPKWARSFASPLYSDREYAVSHFITLTGASVIPWLLWVFPYPWVVFLFFLLWLGPGVFSNALFHAGATVFSRTYCPGTATGLLLYLPLSIVLGWLALSEQVLSAPPLLVAFAVAPLLHALEVGHNVFKRW
jgi:Protein of unknown function with HXXEE motif